MFIKVCGLREEENIAQIVKVKPDALGFIFYPKSKRYAKPEQLVDALIDIPDSIKKVGVFVNESTAEMISIATKLHLQAIQLHGDEDILVCKELKSNGFEVWKAIGIGGKPEWKSLEPYLPFVDAFLFDTASQSRGGTGQPFDHEVLRDYPFEKPFLLSGGIGPDFRSLPDFFDRLPFLGLDLNSRFEIEPGIKNPDQISTFLEFWKNKTHAGKN